MKCILSSILGSVYIFLIHPLTIHVCSPHSISDSRSSILAPPCTHCVTEGKSQFPELYVLQCKSSFNSKYYIAFYLVLGEIIHVSSYFTVWHKEESRAQLLLLIVLALCITEKPALTLSFALGWVTCQFSARILTKASFHSKLFSRGIFLFTDVLYNTTLYF